MPPSRKTTSAPSALEQCVRFNRTYTETLRRIDGKLSSVHGLSFSDFAILHHLSQAHQFRLRRIDLAEYMGLTPSAVTRSLLPLEKIGLVERQSDPHDARVGYARLTPTGRRLCANAGETAEAACQDAIQAFASALG